MKGKIFIRSVLASLVLISCEEFDVEDPTALSEKLVLRSYEYTLARSNAVYGHLPDGLLYVDGAMMASASDEAEHTLETSAIQKFNTGAWNAVDNPDDRWYHYFSGIRKANQFLESADSVDLDVHKLNPDPAVQVVYKTRVDEINRWKYEVRFLRAFFYFELVKRYGGVPLITRSLSLNDDFQSVNQSVKRSSLQDCIQFISAECDSAAKALPVTYSNEEHGRVTKGAALALKSRLLLYAASDLFNTTAWAGGYSNPGLISLGGDRQARWKAAADAAKAVIDLNTYSLSSSYPALFGPANFTNPEIILVRRNGQSNAFERGNYPIGYDPGQSGTTPSQNLVDAYEMTDGSKFNWENIAHAVSPYDNRDPRLGYSILTNNVVFKERPVESWTGGRDGKGIERATKTGYYLNKYINPDINLLQSQSSVHSWVLIRLAEIYLNYAEALNEYSPGNPDIKRYVDLVRNRSGIAMPPLSDGLSQADMRERIRNERRVELAFEGHRFWDLRRWMQAAQYLGSPIGGVEITRNENLTFSYFPITVENRIFEPKMYLYPIPQAELMKASGIIQNPLW